jgi:hypothetical protein
MLVIAVTHAFHNQTGTIQFSSPTRNALLPAGRRRSIMKRILTIAAAAAFAAAPALAQKTDHAAKRPAAAAPAKPAPAAPAKTAAAAPMPHYIGKDTPDLWRTSEITGMDVYNDQNEKIGSVGDVLVDQHGNMKVVVIGVGGFLGIGERNVAVPFNDLHWQMKTSAPANGQRVAQDSNPERAILPGVTKDQLQKAPEFK